MNVAGAGSIDFAVLQQAAEWFAVLRAETVAEHDRLAWQRWLEAQPQHRLAWQRVEHISGQFERLPQRQAARSALQARGVNRRQAVKMLSLLCGGGALLHAARARPWQAWQADQRTAVGEVREGLLSDGSRLWLNTDSAVDVAFSSAERRLALYRGELLVETAGEARPFSVETASGRVQVAGARFGVRERDGATLVLAYEGALEVFATRLGWRQRVEAGEQLSFSADHLDRPTPLRLGAQAWTHGVLQADDMRLTDFIDELARYQHGHLGCDPRVAELRLVGAFPLADRARIFTALEASLPVRVVQRLPWWITVEPRQA
ncbi:FecR domain-containing protein [Pseudomonas sp. UL073]|uniref:FecR domain-containing protein n=1 Tax=Zestomonas insulae TaxID=2809017 RepID=A0ABS2I9J7_9GAMM|nr:FecR domain-containing protein [Pseudomonas insulae]MBM7059460.1 FecR domain-containing protein [Pseudomonas insulae]